MVESLRDEAGPLVISPLVLTEIDYLLVDRFGTGAVRQFYADLLAGAYEVAELNRDDLGKIVEIADRYADMGLGLADASNVVVANLYATARLLCLDEEHSERYRPSATARHSCSSRLIAGRASPGCVGVTA